jgi:cobalt/nickel transport system permease protein
MHLADAALSTPVMAGTNGLAALAVGLGLRGIDARRVPRVGVLAAVFFLASFIRVPIGPSSVHLLLNGLLGLLLGAAALPALCVALFLQSVLLGYGGFSALGANVLIMGLPAFAVGVLLAPRCRTAPGARAAAAWGAAAGAGAVALTCLTAALLLHVSDAVAYAATVKALILAHLPVAAVEAAVTAAAVAFLFRVRPEALGRSPEERV